MYDKVLCLHLMEHWSGLREDFINDKSLFDIFIDMSFILNQANDNLNIMQLTEFSVGRYLFKN